MSYVKTTLLMLLAGVCAPCGAQTQKPGIGETDGFRLVWQDLFDAETLNPERWNIEVNNGGNGNNELQSYTDRDVNVRLGDDGEGNRCLILTARRENYQGKSFTSGRINSKNLTAFCHGKIEARIKIPSTANGLWPAFWMMGNDFDKVGWPACGETDIIEMGHSEGFNGLQDRYFNGAMHWGAGWPNASKSKSTAWGSSIQDGAFHTLTCIWDEESMKMYLDLDRYPNQQPYFRMDIPQNEPENSWSPGNYFHKDNFILFNLAVGGNFPGIHQPEGITALKDENGQSASMYVDYVKIYQKGDSTENLTYLDAGDPFESRVDDLRDYAYDAPPRYYDINGIELGVLPTDSGIYLERKGHIVRKFLVR